MTSAFSTDGETIIKEAVTLKDRFQTEDIHDFYELERSSNWIRSNNFKKVALQFPDELLHSSAAVVQVLKRDTCCEVVVLADTSYGSCCVDEVAAQHYDVTAIIHYGASCLSPTYRLPVLYVFGKMPLNINNCLSEISTVLMPSCKVIVLYDVTYHHVKEVLEKHLRDHFEELVLSSLDIPNQPEADQNAENVISRCGRTVSLPKDKTLSDYTVLFIGSPETLFFTNCVYNFNSCPFYTYDPATNIARKEVLNVNKMLMKRYYMVEKAKDARIVGILVGTLGVHNYLQCLKRLKNMIALAGKKSYTFVVGKLNVPKLANFAEIEVFVLVACGENTLLDTSEFYQPVITPYEMELACNPSRKWSGDYVTDFRQLLPGGSAHVDLPSEPLEIQADVSLISGGLRRLGVDSEGKEPTGGAPAGGTVVKRDDVLTVANTAGEFLSSRSWQGLEQDLGKTPVTAAVEGSCGIAMGYSHEKHDSK